VYYQLQRSDSTQSLSDYLLQWETRTTLSEKNGKELAVIPLEFVRKTWKRVGKIRFDDSEVPGKYLLAKVLVNSQKQVTYFYKTLPQKKSSFLSGQEALMYTFVSVQQPVRLSAFQEGKSVIVSYFNDPFPPGAPAFSTAQAKVSKTIKPDSSFIVEPETALKFEKKGLYLAQQDTTSAEGLAFRVEEDYPKLGKLESLAGPLIYICTKQEYEKLSAAGADKKKFDQLIVGITGNTDRARIFMRNYFKRVELANLYFTSYKEGWKTDRGMLYIIYGQPDEVYLFEDREVWEYKALKTRFQFVKSSTLFDPENFVLIRDKKYTDSWYERVDLWRKARF
jgi:GWxTD domain-containing protein